MKLKEFQDQVSECDKKFGWDNDEKPLILIHLTEEVGEIATNLLKETGHKKGVFDKKELENEIVDALYLTFKLANYYDINLDEAWSRMEERYLKKK